MYHFIQEIKNDKQGYLLFNHACEYPPEIECFSFLT